MNKPKICFAAQFAPPVHGLSKMVDIVCGSEIAHRFELEKINLTNKREILAALFKLIKSDANLFYMTLSQSKLGNVRDLLMLKIAMAKHQRCIVHLHGGYYRQLVDIDLPTWQKKLNYRIMSKTDGAIVLSESFVPIFKGMIDQSSIFVVPNCADTRCIMTDDEFEQKIKSLASKSTRRILYLSNFIPEKGYMKVLESAKIANEHNDRHIHFDFAGAFFDQRSKDEFFEYVKANGLSDIITYHGVADGDQKRQLLCMCDILVLPTQYVKEGQPVCILEAMANGAAVVAQANAAVPDMISDGENGMLLFSDGAGEIYTKIRDLSPEKLVCIARNNREKYFKYYSEDAHISKMSELFDKFTN